MSSDAAPDRDATPEEFIQRAELLADLGRYDDAAMELGYAIALEPANRTARTLLGRVHLAAGRPADAVTAVEPVTAVGPGTAVGPATAVGPVPADIPALNVRAMALIDLRRFAEAAEAAEAILRLGPDDPDALCVGAALLSESRGGQLALNAAWRAVELAPERAEAHLVLGLVAARLRQFQLAEQAYGKALELNPELTDAHHDIGIIRLEQRRYTEALASLAEAAAGQPQADAPPSGGLPTTPRPASPVSRGIRALLHLGAGYAIVVPLLVACASANDGALGRLQAALLGVIGLGVLAVLVTRLPGRPLAVLRPLMERDRLLAVAVYAVASGPLLVLLYALVGSPWPLVLAVLAGMVTLFANFFADPDR